MHCILIHKRLSMVIIAAITTLFGNAQSPRPVPAAYSSTLVKSYVRTWTAAAPEQNPNSFGTRPLRNVKQATQYFDGLGRPLQTVVEQGSLITDAQNPSSSSGAVDMISAQEYDPYGLESFQYLPAPSTKTDATKNDGNFKLNPFAQQATF